MTIGTSTGIGLAGCLESDDADEGTDDGDSAADGTDSDGGDGTEDDSTDSTDDGSADSIDDSEETSTDDGDTADEDELGSGMITATLETNYGDFDVELYAERVPRTVANFVGLATGQQTWIDPDTGEEVEGEPLYDDVLFHRVIEGFMIQTGDPTGTGRGGPGYQFDDEFHEELGHDDAGILSMANSGPDTNGSQFFITLAPQPHLDGRHSVFGKVTEGMETVTEIGSVETDGSDRPVEDVILESVSVDQ